MTDKFVIQFKNGPSGARKVITQVQKTTEPFVSRPVVAFINDTGKPGDRAARKSRAFVAATNNFQSLLELLK